MLCFSQPPPGESGQDDTPPKQEATREATSGGDSAQQEADPEAAAGGDVREELFMAAMEFVTELGWSKKAIAAGTQNM